MNRMIKQIPQDQDLGYNVSDSIDVLEVDIKVEGENPFGRVSSGSIVLRANTMKARWSPEKSGWLSSCSSSSLIHERYKGPLPIFGRDELLIGSWRYDDEQCGIMPGPLLNPDAVQEEVEARLIPELAISYKRYCEYTPPTVVRRHNPHLLIGDVKTFWSRVTYVPRDVLLVRGPTTRCIKKHATCSSDDLNIIHVLVLKEKPGQGHEYERVGIGTLSSWDRSVESVQTLTVVYI